MTDIFYPVAHRSDEEIAALKKRYESFDERIIPQVLSHAGYTAASWTRPTSWGTSHVVYMVTTKERKSPLVLRANIGFGSPETYMDIEKQITDRVAGLGIPVNKVLQADTTRKQFSFDYQIQEMIAGADIEDHFHGSQASYDELSFQIGKYVGLWGGLEFEKFGRFDETLCGTKQTMYDYVVVQLDSDIAHLVDSHVISFDQGVALRNCFEKYKDIMHVKKATLVHYDLADHNIMFDGDQTITGIFDWEAAVVGDPMLDLASAPTWKTHYPRENKLIEGYRSVRDLPEYFQEKINIYRLRTMIWKMVYAIRANILNEDRKKKFDEAVRAVQL